MKSGKKKEGGCFGLLLIVILFPATSLWVTSRVFTAVDLGGIEGLKPGPDSTECRDIREVLSRGRGGESMVIGERELNAYLHETLFGRQKGLTRIVASFEGACVDLRANEVEVFLVRRCFGRLVTMGCVFEVEESGEGRLIRSGGSSVGSMRIRDLAFQFVLDSIRRLAGVYDEELAMIRAAELIQIREGEIEIRN